MYASHSSTSLEERISPLRSIARLARSTSAHKLTTLCGNITPYASHFHSAVISRNCELRRALRKIMAKVKIVAKIETVHETIRTSS
jgi:hypothetical protein